MKKSVFFVVWLHLLVVGGIYGQTPKWGRGDTIDAVNNMDPTYFTNYWYDEWAADTSSSKCRLEITSENGGAYAWDSVAQYFYTDHPITIAGIAVAIAYFRHWESDPYYYHLPVRSDTMGTYDNLFLCDAMPDSLVVRADVSLPLDLSMPHRHFKFPVDRSTTPCSGGTNMEDTVIDMYECYFQNPIIVEDSFYVGMTFGYKYFHQNIVVPQFIACIHSIFNKDLGMGTICKYSVPYTRIRTVKTWPSGPTVVKYEHYPMLMIFPLLVPDTGCADVEGLRVAEVGGDSVRLVWGRTEGQSLWEVSYGPVGVEADSGTVVVCGDTMAVLEGLEHGARYWAYVRAVCEKYNGYTYYGDWSEPVEIYNINRYNVTVEANYGERGMVEGGGVYEEGEVAVLSAHAWMPYIFRQWDDGVVENPRRVVVTQDTVFTALFTDPVGMDVTAEGEVGFSLLPNPASGRVRCVRYGQELGRGVLLLLDAYGREVATVVMEPQERSAWVDVSRLPQGVYFVSLTTAQGVSTQKLVVE